MASPSHALRERVIDRLPHHHGPVQEAAGGAEALVKLETGHWQVLLLDRRLPDLDAEELIQIIKKRFPGIEVVLLDSETGRPLCGSGPVGSWLQAMNEPETAGAERDRCESPVVVRSATMPGGEPLPGMIGSAPVMAHLYRMARLVAPRTTTVLLTGPTGTGKELVARAIHQLSPRATRPFVVVNCAAIPETLLESELFGHVRGAFTGAVQAHVGRIHSAQGGTLFLDEVGELPVALQAKLLRFLEQKEVQRLGSPDVFRVDVRVVAATNADLAQPASGRQFRDDLYYRLAVFPIELPTLAERVPDIIPLARHFLAIQAAASDEPCPVLHADAVPLLESCSWQGNVRELQHVMERAAILAEGGGTILPEHLHFLPGCWASVTQKGNPNRREVSENS